MSKRSARTSVREGLAKTQATCDDGLIREELESKKGHKCTEIFLFYYCFKVFLYGPFLKSPLKLFTMLLLFIVFGPGACGN